MEIYQEALEDVPAGSFSKRVFALDKKDHFDRRTLPIFKCVDYSTDPATKS